MPRAEGFGSPCRMRERMGRREGRHAVVLLSSVICSVNIEDRTCNDCHVTLRNAPADEADEVVV